MYKRLGWWMALALIAGGASAGSAGAQASAEAPFAVTSRGRPLPRGERTVVVVRDSTPARPAADSARTPPRATPPTAGAATAAATTTRPAATPAAPRTTPTTPQTTPATRAGTAAPAPRTHVVAYGETFFGIANRYGVTAAALRAANPDVDQEKLVSGRTLRIPAAAPAAAAPASGAPATTARPRSAPARRTHRVEAGESLWGIARRFEVSMEAIRRANDMQDDRVRIGQTLVIPEAD